MDDVHEHRFTVTITCSDDQWDSLFPSIPSMAADDPGTTSTEYAAHRIDLALLRLRDQRGEVLPVPVEVDVRPSGHGER